LIDDLLRVAPAVAAGEVTPVDWADMQRRLGCGLPDDYKSLIETYVPGTFGGFIHIFRPAVPYPSIDLEEQIESSASALAELRRGGERIPYRLDEPSELMAAGRTDNGDIIYFVRRPLDEPNSWTIAVNESRGDEWNEFAGGITDFLANAISGARRFTVFPASFPMDVVPFEPYDI
jgi:SMI1 / KNR4 family (SUKH-1)